MKWKITYSDPIEDVGVACGAIGGLTKGYDGEKTSDTVIEITPRDDSETPIVFGAVVEKM